MSKSDLMPYEYEDAEWVDPDTVHYLNVTFNEDWGPWKKYETLQLLAVNHYLCVVQSFANDRMIQEVKFKAVPND